MQPLKSHDHYHFLLHHPHPPHHHHHHTSAWLSWSKNIHRIIIKQHQHIKSSNIIMKPTYSHQHLSWKTFPIKTEIASSEKLRQSDPHRPSPVPCRGCLYILLCWKWWSRIGKLNVIRWQVYLQNISRTNILAWFLFASGGVKYLLRWELMAPLLWSFWWH